ncbi:hypothetical protein F4703DRAFT_1865317 [Phycomyces blakesleeanus]
MMCFILFCVLLFCFVSIDIACQYVYPTVWLSGCGQFVCLCVCVSVCLCAHLCVFI